LLGLVAFVNRTIASASTPIFPSENCLCGNFVINLANLNAGTITARFP
jgi:hypothetical protein